MAVSLLHIQDFIDFNDPVFDPFEVSYKDYTKNPELHSLICLKINYEVVREYLAQNETVFLTHPNNDLLNLPWEAILFPELNPQLRPKFFRTHPCYFKATDFKPFEPPLRVLIMMSSPEDSEPEHSLDFEDEELKILKAFEPFLLQSRIEIEFTEDATFQTLQKKLDEKQYHILHISSHGEYDRIKQEHYTVIENENDFMQLRISDVKFEKINKCKYPVPFVFLSICESGRGCADNDYITGLSNRLLKSGTKALLAFSAKPDDKWCTQFTYYFYQELSKGKDLGQVFQSAHTCIVNNNAFSDEFYPRQSLIPILYVAQPIKLLVDFSLTSRDDIPVDLNLGFRIEKRPGNFKFLGKRLIIKQALHSISTTNYVFLTGQGGTGKTCMAEYLVQRLSLSHKNIEPILINKSVANNIFSVYIIVGKLLSKKRGERSVNSIPLSFKENWICDHINFLIEELSNYCCPVFIFDNMESLQEDLRGPLKSEYAWINEFICSLIKNDKVKIIATGRYPLDFIPSYQESVINLTSASVADFVKKINDSGLSSILRVYSLVKSICYKRATGDISFSEKPGSSSVTLLEFIKYLHHKLGGNYRALEYFIESVREKIEVRDPLSSSLEKFENETRGIFRTILESLTQNLAFDVLWNEFSEEEKQILFLLSKFNLPVEAEAIVMQGNVGTSVSKTLEKSTRLTLSESHSKKRYFVTPLISEMILNSKTTPGILFNHKNAGFYYWHYIVQGTAFKEFLKNPRSIIDVRINTQSELKDMVQKVRKNIIETSFLQNSKDPNAIALAETKKTELNSIFADINDFFYNQPVKYFIEAFHHYNKAADYEGMNNIADPICQFYSNKHEFSKTIYWASLAVKLIPPELISVEILHCYGAALIHLNTNLDIARKCYFDIIYRTTGRDEMDAISLMNIAQVDLMQRKYKMALSILLFCHEIYLDSLSIMTHLLYTELGWAYSGLKEFSVAQRYYNKALIFCRNNSVSSTQTSSVLSHLGDLNITLFRIRASSYKKKLLKKAREYFQDAIDITDNINAKGIGRIKLGEVLYEMGLFDKAEEAVRTGILELSYTQNHEVVADGQKKLAKIIKAQEIISLIREAEYLNWKDKAQNLEALVNLSAAFELAKEIKNKNLIRKVKILIKKIK